MENLKTGDIVPVANGLLPSRGVHRLIRPVHPDLIPGKIKEVMARYGYKWLSRNSPCPCGSGKKFKACCIIGRK